MSLTAARRTSSAAVPSRRTITSLSIALSPPRCIGPPGLARRPGTASEWSGPIRAPKTDPPRPYQAFLTALPPRWRWQWACLRRAVARDGMHPRFRRLPALVLRRFDLQRGRHACAVRANDGGGTVGRDAVNVFDSQLPFKRIGQADDDESEMQEHGVKRQNCRFLAAMLACSRDEHRTHLSNQLVLRP